MGNSLLWQASISGEIHPAEEGFNSGERRGEFLGSGGWSWGTSGSVCLHPHPKDHLEVLMWLSHFSQHITAVGRLCDLLTMLLLYKESLGMALILLHLITLSSLLWHLQPLCALLIHDVSLLHQDLPTWSP